MNQLVAFNFESSNVRACMGENGEPMFVAADVLSTLSLDRKALERLDDDEKGVNSIHTPGGPQDMTVVNESGLFNLVLGSRKPEAILLASDGVEGIFALRDIHHVRWISDNAYTGISPISLHRDAIGVALATERHTGKMFGNGTNLSGVITRPAASPAIKDPAAIERITSDWASKYAGTDNVGRVALLQEGMEFKPLSMTNDDAQQIAARQYSVRDIARIYGIPAHMLGDLDRATHSNIEQQSLEFVIYTLMPWLSLATPLS